jgi:exopolyphosphatase/guanosine-5'-triphosphate,3'-diphosphate pyrophosphatase
MLNLVSVNGESRSTQPMQQNRIIAAIDIGTNSLHMVVVNIESTTTSFSIIAREKETVRLGNCDQSTGDLKPETMNLAIACLGRFQQLAQTFGADSVIAVATSAVREAPNGQEFLQRVAAQTGLNVDLISGQEEARRIYLGVLSGMELHNQMHIIIDIGGGSTELILCNAQEALSLTSTKIGAVRLTAELITSDPINDMEFHRLQVYVRGMLERSVKEIQSNLLVGDLPKFVGTSGTIETLAIIHAQAKLGFIPSTLNGYQFSLVDLREWVERLRRMTEIERATIPGIPEKRAEVILAGAIILLEAMTLLNVGTVTVCERSLREGVIVDWMLMHGYIDNKLQFQSSIRQRSVLRIAKKYHLNLAHGDRVADFAISLFDQTQKILHNWGEEERKLLWAAAVLHNCGHYVSHSAHHKHSYYLIRHGELLGYNETEIEIIANLARYHRKSPPKKKHDNYRNLLHKEHRQMVNQLSAILRLAVALDRRQIGAVSQIKCEYLPDSREFNLWVSPANRGDECDLELWSLDYKKGVFAEEFGVKMIVKLLNS